jgi:8-oxo-dGTP pyrophosphatase MutT (NUDIX family)
VTREPASAPAEAIPRQAARVLLIDAADRVLMLRGFDPARPDIRYWFTVGGGLDPGESSLDGAVRELREEVGLRLSPGDLTGPVHHETVRFPFDGRWYEQRQAFYVARVDAWNVDTSGQDEVELVTVDAHRWWSLDELAATDERYYPPDLVDLIRRVLGEADDSEH